jgi:hypothetical protein
MHLTGIDRITVGSGRGECGEEVCELFGGAYETLSPDDCGRVCSGDQQGMKRLQT